MAAVKNQNAALAPVLGEGQRRLLLEVLRANLRAKNALPVVGICGDQPAPPSQPGARQGQQQRHSGASLADRRTVASVVSGSSGLHPALAERLGSSVGPMEVDAHAAGQGSQPCGVGAGASGSDVENTAAHASHACAPDGRTSASGGMHASKSSSDVCAGSEDPRAGSSGAGAGGISTQQGLSAALFSRLSESLPRDQGALHFLTWADGSCYCGHLTAGSLDGVGVYRYPDDSIYCGQWVRDHLQGQGAFITPGGFIYRGGFQADKQHGAGIFVVPGGKTFFGTFRNGRLHGLSCCVSSSGASLAILGEWHDGEFQKVFSLNPRVADFYIRVADSVDLLGGCWLPLAIPPPEVFSAAADEAFGAGAAYALQQRLQQLPRTSMMEALRTELPTSLLQVAAASAQEEVSLGASQLDRHPNARLACAVKPVVRKRKVGLGRPHARDSREASAGKGRCLMQEGGGGAHHGGAGGGAPQRAATTKAQLLRWESEARKLPRIPHLNYNRVLGRWYARVRDPASGRRIWKGYTCAVHGFYQARDMAIDRLRQFSQLVSPLGSNGEPEHALPVEEQQTPTAGEAAVTLMDRSDLHEMASAETICTDTADGAFPEQRRSATASLEIQMEDGASSSSDALACEEAASALMVGERKQSEPRQAAAAEANFGEEAAVAALQSTKTGGEGFVNEMEGEGLAPARANQEEGDAAAAAAAASLPVSAPPEAQEKQHLCSAGEQQKQQAAAHAFGTDKSAAEACCRHDPLLPHDGDSLACSRLTTADCGELSLGRCTLLSL
ncbi:hypothetical protein ACSSS7_000414 [Eimeria intestinalis]